ncbi:hypothetical protein DPMN_160675 [Dreissena polymorpha]|uniref:Uncharacterized protein n=1 Tax=Dreissena polymorpha TaxID=45954 RepID=A0A9D4EQP7_DREPO|nr:hypothetical protein DPMN_160675 [Dreissena polymorpha]
MAPLAVTGRRHPRDSFPSALSVLSTAVPGSLNKATPSKFQACFNTSPGKKPVLVRPVFPPHWWSRCPTIPVPLQTGPLAGPGQRALDDRQRVTSPLHLGEDSNPSSAEDVRLEGDGLSWISRATRRSSPQVRKSAGDSRLGRDAHAPAADRVIVSYRPASYRPVDE